MINHSLAPISSNNATVLILGSMPGIESLKQQQYYAYPRNAFWYIIEQLIGIDATTPYDNRIKQLKHSKVALWDVLASCYRPGSLDSNIDPASITINNISQFIHDHPNIQCIGLNGGKAFTLFERYIIKPGKLPRPIHYKKLPSTSPAFASLNKMQKSDRWADLIKKYLC